MKSLFILLGAAGWLATLGAGAAQAQQQGQDQGQSQGQQNPQSQDQQQQQPPTAQGPTKPQEPIPAYRSPLAGVADEEDEDTTEVMPDNHALTGVIPLGLGINAHSYWQPHANLFTSVDSNPTQTTGHTSWGTWASLSGGVDVHKVSAGNNLDLSYLGAGSFSTDSAATNGAVQTLSFSDRKLFHRWALSIVDSLNYLPESSFGFGGLLGTPLPGSGIGVGTPGPGQSLFVGLGQNLGNAFDTEADVFLTGRTSLTFVGGYSTLKNFDSNLLNYGTANASAGYNYEIDRRDTIGLAYTFGDTSYSNFHQSIVDHTFHVAYSRRVTGRLAFQIGAGPDIAIFQVPITAGPGGGAPVKSSGATSLYWSLSTNLAYALRRTSFSLGYNHGVSGGSGVLAGSDSDTVNGTITRQITRLFSSGITGGYSRNRGLAVINTTTPLASQTFDSWYGGGNFSRPIGRTLALSLTYMLQYQNSGAAFCIGKPCATDVLRNTISVGFNWNDRKRRF